MKYLHLINNEKITQSMISLFQRVNLGEHFFVIFNRSKEYLSNESLNDYVLPANAFLNSKIKKVHFDVVLIHSLDIKKVNFIEKNIKYPAKFIWLLWGGDIYNRPEYGYKLFRRRTLRTLLNSNLGKELPKYLINWTRKYYGEFKKIKMFSKRIDIIATTVYEDYSLAKKILEINPAFKEFNFYFLKDDIENSGLQRSETGKINVLIGNSGDPSNNHIDLIKDLSKFKCKDKVKYYFILSYGNQNYIQKVINYGKRILENQFYGIKDFLNLEDYTALLNNVDIGVFGFKRQQGFGNIVQLLLLKKAVFLDSNNPCYSYFINHGVDIREIDSLDLNSPSSYSVNSENNSKIIQELFCTNRGEFLAKELLR